MSGDYVLEDTVYFPFTTRAFATGVPTALVSGQIDWYEDVTATPIVTSETLAVSLNSVAGFNMITCLIAAAEGFESGKSYTAILAAGTVGGVSVVGEVVAHFTVDMSAAAQDLANGTDGLGAIKADTNSVKTKTDFLPSATAGTAGGVFISGTNSPVTITGAGDALTLLSTSTNGAGLKTTGNGSGAGLEIAGGATGNGMTVDSGDGSAIVAQGTGTGAGISVIGGSTGNGFIATGGGTSGAGLRVQAGASGSHGVELTGLGAGSGLSTTGGSTGHGLAANGGTNGDGIVATLGGTGVDIRGDITGDLTGTVATLTTYTGNTLQTGDVATLITTVGTAGAGLTDLGGMSTGMKGEVNTEVDNALNVTTYAEPGQELPASTTTIQNKIGYLYKAWRNRSNQTATTYQLFNDDATTVDQKATVSDNATTAEKGEVATGP